MNCRNGEKNAQTIIKNGSETHICNLTEDNFVASLNREYAYFQFNERRIQTVENRLALIQNQRQTRDARHTRIAEIDTEIEQITELMLQDYANRQQFELIFDICDNSGVSTCDICMVDDIPNTGMVKTGCGHDYCAICMLRILNKNPECAFCRGKINKICVSSQEAFDCFCER